MTKGQPLWRRASFAWAGLREAWKTEVSFRTEVVLIGLTLIAFAIWNPPGLRWDMLVLACALILSAELFNSSIERVVDRLHPEEHEDIGAVKDMAAGGVFTLVLAALVIVALMLKNHLLG